MNKVPLTVRGAEKLRSELNELKGVVRPRIIKAIAEAREHGDLRENAEYHAAREQQGFVEGRIKDLEAKLSNAQIIDVKTLNAGGRTVFGATVDVLETATGEEHTYQIVGEDEADIREGLISVSSPIARALIGKSEGDVAVVQAPGGEREFEVLEVRYE
jgi:transcription elongation factor GreA